MSWDIKPREFIGDGEYCEKAFIADGDELVYGRYGAFGTKVSRKDIEALLQGKYLCCDIDGEYLNVLYLDDKTE